MKVFVILPILFAFPFSSAFSRIGYMQKYAVKGKLMCGNKIAETTIIRLNEDTLGEEEVIAQVMSEDDGTFYIEGKTREISRIEPILRIYTYCDDNYPCLRTWSTFLPKIYIMKEAEDTRDKTVDIGVVNLEIQWRREQRTCFHG